MEFTLYNCQSDNYEVPKTLETVSENITGTLRSEIDIINPVIQTVTDMRTGNYIYIPEFGRYYYITGIRTIRTGLYEMQCKTDVLQSWYNYIVNCPITAARASYNFNTYIPDNEREFFAYTLPQYITIADIGAPDTAIMVTVG